MPKAWGDTLFKVNPDGTILYDFEGHIKAVGLDLVAGDSHPGPDNKVRWLRQSDGAVVAEIRGMELTSGDVVELRGMHRGVSGQIAQAAIVGANAAETFLGEISTVVTKDGLGAGLDLAQCYVQAGVQLKLLLDSTGASDFSGGGGLLFKTHQIAGASYTTNTGVVADIDATNLAATVTTPANGARIDLSYGSLSAPVAVNAGFDLYVDGAFYSRRSVPLVGGTATPGVITYLYTGAAGSHTFTMRWFQTGATTVTLARGATSPLDFLITKL